MVSRAPVAAHQRPTHLDKVGPADMRRLQQRRLARLISRAKTRYRNNAPTCPEYKAFVDLLYRLEKKNRVRRVLLARAGATR
ncbi:hypothetical protein ACIBCT_39105 [Streptosporangium sp. NPDC050855]|uniref:hypothetical protein n=1 Tax=Streptosporangium sp. NPDC050855 TaxID=3366194 RepID=UPI00378780BB